MSSAQDQDVEKAAASTPPASDDAPADKPSADNRPNDEPPYSVFGKGTKALVVAFAATAAFFSPLSSSIYFPVLPDLSDFYNRPVSQINLTITVYMIFQGVAPMVTGAFADSFGRRPVYIALFVAYIASCIGMALQSNYAALMVLRCLQSSGSSGTVALANGVVGDVASRKERGGYMGYVLIGANLGPSLGPIFGGLIGERVGWRWIFWFLAIFGGVVAFILIVFLPETGRNIVGNGSLKPPIANMSVVQVLQYRKLSRKAKDGEAETDTQERPKLKMPNFLQNFKMFLEIDIAIILLFMSLVFAAQYCLLATLPPLFLEIYGYNSLQSGLCYLPQGAGLFVASLIGGKLLNRDYQKFQKRQPPDALPEDFPIEEARVARLWIVVPITLVGYIGYGWALEAETSVAAPLALSFILGAGIGYTFIAFSTLLIDLYPQQPSTVTATNNLSRCLFGAGATAAIDPMIAAMGRGWCFTFLSLLGFCMLVLLYVEQRHGKVWRKRRNARLNRSE